MHFSVAGAGTLAVTEVATRPGGRDVLGTVMSSTHTNTRSLRYLDAFDARLPRVHRGHGVHDRRRSDGNRHTTVSTRSPKPAEHTMIGDRITCTLVRYPEFDEPELAAYAWWINEGSGVIVVRLPLLAGRLPAVDESPHGPWNTTAAAVLVHHIRASGTTELPDRIDWVSPPRTGFSEPPRQRTAPTPSPTSRGPGIVPGRLGDRYGKKARPG